MCTCTCKKICKSVGAKLCVHILSHIVHILSHQCLICAKYGVVQSRKHQSAFCLSKVIVHTVLEHVLYSMHIFLLKSFVQLNIATVTVTNH